MVGSTPLLVVAGFLVLGGAIALLIAPSLSRRLVQRRALSLPPDLAERFHEEWLSELAHLGSRAAQLAFALRLVLTKPQALVDAADTIEEDGVVVSVDDLRIAPGPSELQSAHWLDYLAVMMPGLAALVFHLSPLGLMVVAFTWNSLWVLFAHVVCVRLWGATPGMLRAGVRIVTLDGSPLEWTHILRRARSIAVALVLFFPPALALTFASNNRWPTWVWPGVNLLWGVTALLEWRSRQKNGGRSLDHTSSGTTLTMRIPTVVGRSDTTPRGSTSLMR